ncbi:MAG TPA: hypothetical protein DCL38_02535 [Lachnospiraceae bacterium]|nr:hypothetical protein [Lachnospiraceae bacterium]
MDISEKIPFFRMPRNKREQLGNYSLMAAVFILTTAYFHFYSWYSLLAPYGTLVAAVFLIVTFFCYTDIDQALRDPAFLLMVFADLYALVNLFIIGSDKGAILTIADFLLILYLANKVSLSERQMEVCAVYIGIFFIYWTIDVKGYFKGYNTNYGGLVLISGFIFLIYEAELLYERLRTAANSRYKPATVRTAELLLFYVAFRIIAWYRSRCALVGLVVFLVLLLIPKGFWKNRVMYGLLTALGSVGSVLFSAFYVWLGMRKEELTLRLFYKDIISGREEIWAELWEEYLKHPLTGIGSSYVMKLEWMEGLFEVHSGLLDILIVHGLVVFIITCTFLVFRLLRIREICTVDTVSKTAMAGIFAMLFTAFMENYIIVAPFSLMLLMLFSFINRRLERLQLMADT